MRKMRLWSELNQLDFLLKKERWNCIKLMYQMRFGLVFHNEEKFTTKEFNRRIKIKLKLLLQRDKKDCKKYDTTWLWVNYWKNAFSTSFHHLSIKVSEFPVLLKDGCHGLNGPYHLTQFWRRCTKLLFLWRVDMNFLSQIFPENPPIETGYTSFRTSMSTSWRETLKI